MPKDGDTKIVRKGLTFNRYEYIVGEPGYADGWWDTNETPPAYGGNGEEVDTSAVDPGPPETERSDAALLYEQENPGATWPPTDKEGNPDRTEMRYWQSEVFRQRKAEEKLPAETGTQPIFWTDPATGQRYFKSSPTDQWQREPPLRTPSIDDLIVSAIMKNDYDSAIALDDFAKRPSQTQRLQLAIQAAQSPADYLSVVGMMRGEIPIQPSGSKFRLGPESQALAAFGFGGQGEQGAPGAQAALGEPQAPQGMPEQQGLPALGASQATQGRIDQLDRQIEDLTEELNLPQGRAEQQRIQNSLALFQAERSRIANELQGSTSTTQLPEQPKTDGGVSANGGLPTFLQQAYGQDILAGKPLTQRLSYPELAEQQGVTIPRFRSAQARSIQTPLEQRLFEEGLKLQGVDLETYLAQERGGTTPGGGRRRRIEIVGR